MKSINGKEITKSTAVFEKDDDCHDYCIHEDDLNLFLSLIQNEEDENEFNNIFGKYMTGMAPNIYRKRFLK